MRRSHTRTAAAITAVAAGGLAAFTLRPADTPTAATLAANTPPVEVRTQVITRTVHVIRHQSGAHHPGRRGAIATGTPGSSKGGSAGGAVRTSASGSHISRRHQPASSRC